MKIAILGGVGTASGFSLALIQALRRQDYYVVAIARGLENKATLIDGFNKDHNVQFIAGDLEDPSFMCGLVNRLEAEIGEISLYIHNAAKLVLKPFLDATIEDFETSWNTGVKTAVIATQAVLPKMLARNQGTIIYTGATASLKGNAKSSPFAAAKFGLRALSQSLAREFGPQGIHVVHTITDGVIVGERAQKTFGMEEKQCIDPEPMATLYLDLVNQDKSCWTQEIDLRPYQEQF